MCIFPSILETVLSGIRTQSLRYPVILKMALVSMRPQKVNNESTSPLRQFNNVYVSIKFFFVNAYTCILYFEQNFHLIFLKGSNFRPVLKPGTCKF